MELHEHVWCAIHGESHAPSGHAYDGAATRHDDDGNPVWLDPATMKPKGPDCEPANWRKLWIGAPVGEGRTSA